MRAKTAVRMKKMLAIVLVITPETPPFLTRTYIKNAAARTPKASAA